MADAPVQMIEIITNNLITYFELEMMKTAPDHGALEQRIKDKMDEAYELGKRERNTKQKI